VHGLDTIATGLHTGLNEIAAPVLATAEPGHLLSTLTLSPWHC
jgi:hypothetical protein